MLNKQHLATAKAAVQCKGPGVYSAKELLDGEWDLINRPRAYGKWFKASVLSGDLPGVSLHGKRSNKSLEYEVSQRTDRR